MNLEKAVEIMHDVLAIRKRWGNLGGTGTYSISEILDAALLVSEERESSTDDQEAITKLKRQLGAAKAREAKLVKKLATYKSAQT